MKWEEALGLAKQGRLVQQEGRGFFVTSINDVLVTVDGEHFVPDKLEEFEMKQFASENKDWHEVK